MYMYTSSLFNQNYIKTIIRTNPLFTNRIKNAKIHWAQLFTQKVMIIIQINVYLISADIDQM